MVELSSTRPARVLTISAPSATPIVESGLTTDIGGTQSNSPLRIAAQITGAATAGQPATGYTNAVDLTQRYTYLNNESGHNEALDSNDGRTQISANRVRLIHAGQGDAGAYNFSVWITGEEQSGVTHWLANPAGIGVNGTVVIAADGAYANPREIYMTDKPDAVAFRGVAVGDVIRMDRNQDTLPKASGGVGEFWTGYRAISTGPIAVDAILTATGKYKTGIDLSMASADFDDYQAIVLKALDRVVFDGSAAEVDDGTIFIRADTRATNVGRYYANYKSDDGTPRLQFVADNLECLALRVDVTNGATASVANLNINLDVFQAAGKTYRIGGSQVLSGRKSGWSLPTATLSRAAISDASDLAAVRSALAALITDLYYTTAVHTGGHGLIGS